MRRRGVQIVIAVLVAGVLFLALNAVFKSSEIIADFSTVKFAPMRVTISNEGRTRIKDFYAVSAPTGGKLLRLAFRAGDTVAAGEIVAVIQPSTAPFLNKRSEAEAEAKVEAAKATREQAKADLARAEAALRYAKSSYERIGFLRSKDAASQKALEEAEMVLKTRQAELDVAQKTIGVREKEVSLAQASLTRTSTGGEQSEDIVEVRAPVGGSVLKILQESETVVSPGQALLQMGDPGNLEIVVEMLSANAVKVVPGMETLIDNWGGKETLHGVVRTVEPLAFTKVSALGIEEQRVNVIIGLTDDRQLWKSLGHGFRVDVSVITWESERALVAPMGAVFRDGEQSSVYVVENGRAVLRHITVGQTNTTQAEIVGGISAGNTVILYPSDRIKNGGLVRDRATVQ